MAFRTIAMVAGETSGDILGAGILSALKPKYPDALYHGIGGPNMARYDFVSNFPMEALSVNGLFEVVSHYREIRGIHDSLKVHLKTMRPGVFVGIDSAEFNLSLEGHLRKDGIPTVHVVSPSVWAWRSGRIKKIRQAVSHMLVLFPFEEKIYRDAGIPVTCIGHPLAQRIPIETDRKSACEVFGVDPDKPIVAVLPGSRMSEIKQHSAPFLDAVSILHGRDPSIQFLLPMAGEKQVEAFVNFAKGTKYADLPVIVSSGYSHAAMAACDAALVASGTATLEVALHKKPMVIAYHLMWATWQIARHIVKPPVGLPNILCGEMVVPELLQNDCNGEKLADALMKQLTDETNRHVLRDRFAELHDSLRRNTPQEAADAIASVIEDARA